MKRAKVIVIAEMYKKTSERRDIKRRCEIRLRFGKTQNMFWVFSHLALILICLYNLKIHGTSG